MHILHTSSSIPYTAAIRMMGRDEEKAAGNNIAQINADDEEDACTRNYQLLVNNAITFEEKIIICCICVCCGGSIHDNPTKFEEDSLPRADNVHEELGAPEAAAHFYS